MCVRLILLVLALLGPLGAHLPEVQERCLSNGLRVLIVPRPQAGAVHARWALRVGTADTGGLPPVAAEALARCLFRKPSPADLGKISEAQALLEAEEGAYEALRLARLRGAMPEGGEPSVAALQAHQAALRARLDGVFGPSGRPYPAIHVEADLISGGLDLAVADVEPWLRQEGERLRHLVLASYPEVRTVLREELVGPGASDRQAQEALLGAAFPGEAYGRAASCSVESLEGLGWSALRTWARGVVVPERMLLILVGEVDLGRWLPVLEKTLGGWTAPPEGRFDRSMACPEPRGARRLQVSLPIEPQIFLAWHIPHGAHPDHLALEVLAQAMKDRLWERFQVSERRPMRTLDVTCGFPGLRDAGLFVIRMRPAPGQSLEALDALLRSEHLRLQREAFSEEALRRAQRQLEAAELQLQEGASTLALALSQAQLQLGDWHRAFRFRSLGRDLEPYEVQRVARTYLIPERSITVALEPDPILNPQDALEAQLLETLRALVRARVSDVAQEEAIVREALIQLRMLTGTERERILQLLRGQVKP